MGEQTVEERDLPDEQNTDAVDDETILQPGLWVGLLIGLVVVSIGAVSWAWLNRTPPVVVDDLDDTMTALRQTSTVVVTTALLTAVYLTAGAFKATDTARAKFLAFTSPTLIAGAVIVFIGWHRSETREVLDDASAEQAIPGAADIQPVLTVAWLIACATLVVLAFVAARSYLPFYELSLDEPTSRRPIRVAVVTVTITAIVGSVIVAVVDYRMSPYEGEVATDVVVAPIPGVPVQENYPLESVNGLTITGAGYALRDSYAIGASDRQETIEGFDGKTGERLWWFAARGNEVTELWTTGTGENSVLVARVDGKGADGFAGSPFIGLDATTGERLWTKWFQSLVNYGYPFVLTTADVLLLRERTPGTPARTVATPSEQWTALSPRTGEVMWTRRLPDDCRTEAHAAADAIVMTTCEGDPDIIATLLDPATGRDIRTIRQSSLGVHAPPGTSVRVRETQGKHAVVSLSGPHDHDWVDTLLDLDTGRVVRTFPDAALVRFIGQGSLFVQTYRPDHGYSVSVFDILSRRTTETGLYVGEEISPTQPLPWVSLGDSVVGTAADTVNDEARSRGARWDYDLWVVSSTGEHTPLPDPCGSDETGFPQVAPGALLVSCDGDVTAMN
ncbi:PQQ-binding-like beta-propeller repeat protein [Gordonia sp. LSe1-13]|uniref:PQQ-binding-like beta-propeller repeat protein n=1 Tax=Gordonia sesuvii TaxID=3116777 RepID=A0ABU7M9T6_9ACTN|nr:PQQ-binding-like beta-propeller repeat protein [Gordonia sp. LSe1-13]